MDCPIPLTVGLSVSTSEATIKHSIGCRKRTKAAEGIGEGATVVGAVGARVGAAVGSGVRPTHGQNRAHAVCSRPSTIDPAAGSGHRGALAGVSTVW